MSSTAIQARQQPSTNWAVAILAAVLTHVVILGAVEWLGIFDPPETRRVHEPIDIVFSQPAPVEQPADETDEPTQFSELPEDRADVAPDDPDFLSNVDSRARDRAIADQETDLPRMQGESEAPHVALAEPSGGTESAQSAGEEGQREQPSPTEAGGDEANAEREAGDAATRSREGASLAELLRDRDRGRTGDPGAESGRSGRPGSGQEDAIRQEQGAEPRYSLRANGEAYFQDEMNNPGGNVSLFGDISLNTLNWEFAPWIQRFVRDYHRNWFPPYAYGALGLISGYQLVDLEVAPDGTLLRLEVVEEEGHEALTESTLTTFRAFAPYQPLPRNFPEPTLKLRVKVVYPRRR